MLERVHGGRLWRAAPLIAAALDAARRRRGLANGAGCRLEAAATLADGVARAAQCARPGDVVLLSPGGTSFDAFVDFEARGRAFRDLVGGL